MRTKFSVAAIASMLALAILAGDADALRSFEIRGGERGVTRSGRIAFGETELEATRIACNLSLLMTFNRVIPKRRGEVIGKVTGIAIDIGTGVEPHCERGALYEELRGMVPLRERGEPGTHRELGAGIHLYVVTGGAATLWNMVYNTFLGTLPIISGIDWQINGVRLEVRVRVFLMDVVCLYEGTIFGLTTTDAEGRVVSSAIWLALSTLTTESRGLCVNPLKVSGTLRSSPPLSVALL